MILTLRGMGPVEGPHPHGSLGAVAEGFGSEDGESRRGRETNYETNYTTCD